MECIECGTELNALNISDIEPKICGECCDEALDFIAECENSYELRAKRW